MELKKIKFYIKKTIQKLCEGTLRRIMVALSLSVVVAGATSATAWLFWIQLLKNFYRKR